MREVRRLIFVAMAVMACAASVMAGTLKGVITDSKSGEPLIGATVQIEGTTKGVAADIDGNYVLEAQNGTYNIVVSYVGYTTTIIEKVKIVSGETILNIQLDANSQMIGEVEVVARRVLSGEGALQAERINSSIAIENIGSKEMSIKGLSDVQQGVKKITGVSIADAGQLIVRGLGDRYSTTTLNGLPIASPNPDNKLIPLDLFPTSTVEAVTVSKVYDANDFADYSGAHIDINTREYVAKDFFSVSGSIGGNFNTLGKDFYRMDRSGSLLKNKNLSSALENMTTDEVEALAKQGRVFNTTFDVEKKSTLPEFSLTLSGGKNFDIANQKLTFMASLSASNGQQRLDGANYKTINTNGDPLDDYDYDSYEDELKIAALGYLGTTLRRMDRVEYTFFFARNASDTYKYRTGFDADDNDYSMIGSNNVTHVYTLQNHQLAGRHYFGSDDQWLLSWGGSYGKTSSDEPDRRQVMFRQSIDDGSILFLSANKQGTMRFFGSLTEEEWNAKMSLQWSFGEKSFVKVGFNYKDKDRDYSATNFFYPFYSWLRKYVDDVYTPSAYINNEYFNKDSNTGGRIALEKHVFPYQKYLAGNQIYAGFITTDIYPISPLLINVGLRYEISKQWVRYAKDGQDVYAERRDLDKNDLFPALNMKYSLNEENVLRFSASRTVTRPSFIEMAPFRYTESFGSANIIGNEDLQNGYNYNLDLRYELIKKDQDMFSITAYYKYLDEPIERVQRLSSGLAEHTFQNADNGDAWGAELEFRKRLVGDLRLAANVSYMHTNVKLPATGAYTNKERSLQGASPILVNADLTYNPRFSEESDLSLALLYNLQGSRIHSVGIQGLGDVKQDALHTLNFVAGWAINKHFSLKLEVDDILNRTVIFRQEIPTTNEKIVVEHYKPGTSFAVGFTYTL